MSLHVDTFVLGASCAMGRVRPAARLRPLVLAVVISLIAACAGAPVKLVVPAQHPASPQAPEARLPPPFTALSTPPAEPTPPVDAAPPAADAEAATVMYTCPMHPDIHNAGPGRCPKCNMTLVPERDPDAPKGGRP